MKASRTLITLSTLACTLSISTVARAEDDLALSFELEKTTVKRSATNATLPPPEANHIPPKPPEASETPLPIPPGAGHPPLASVSGEAPPNDVYGGGQALALAGKAASTAASQRLPAPPPNPSSSTTSAPKLPPETDTKPAIAASESVDVAISFDLETHSSESTNQQAKRSSQTEPPPQETTAAIALEALFTGGSESIVARAVGSAEGTRTPAGHRTPAYFGHVDPGNGAWNLGTFSYQHGATSPEAADQQQLRRLRSQTAQLRQKAQRQGLELSLQELLNGIDLANQAPMAALDRGGYIEWLAKARQMGMAESEAIVWARTRSFLDPDTQRWNAPGLGNNVSTISQDQSRRAAAIDRALAATSNQRTIARQPPKARDRQPPETAAAAPQVEAIDVAFQLDLPSPDFPTVAAAAPEADRLTARLPSSATAETDAAAEPASPSSRSQSAATRDRPDQPSAADLSDQEQPAAKPELQSAAALESVTANAPAASPKTVVYEPGAASESSPTLPGAEPQPLVLAPPVSQSQPQSQLPEGVFLPTDPHPNRITSVPASAIASPGLARPPKTITSKVAETR